MEESSFQELGGHRSTSMDNWNPLYLSNSDNPGAITVSQTFDGITGFHAWKRDVWIAVSAKNKSGYLDETCERPSDDDQKAKAWDWNDDMVISWLLNALQKDIADNVLFYPTAKEIWSELQERFGQANGVRLFQVQKNLASISQGADNITSFYTRIKRLWDELAGLQCIPLCTCTTKQEMLKSEQNYRLMTFLMGLVYRFVRLLIISASQSTIPI